MLINKKSVRQYILDRFAADRYHTITQVSAEAYREIDAQVRKTIDRMVHRHPSKGKTFKP